ncbi:uncharacterized protein CEXT_23711 [Caerostris extrusa]|uniref:Uncharacterized protein n=1 Tax=Caerostris extrusa TaxID=172846 RepID=A0AAV4PGK2_CAEEX|nr:uncharacterized protein CEXT_23711 [Caerostris extrusa]
MQNCTCHSLTAIYYSFYHCVKLLRYPKSKMKIHYLIVLFGLLMLSSSSEAGLCSWICRSACVMPGVCHVACKLLCTDPETSKTYTFPVIDTRDQLQKCKS